MKVEALVLGINVGPIMEVLGQESAVWTFLVEGMTYYLDVRCSRANSGIYLLLKLNIEEMQMFLAAGRSYLDQLAAQVQAYPPWYYSRSQPVDVQQRAGDALSRSLRKHLHDVRENVLSPFTPIRSIYGSD